VPKSGGSGIEFVGGNHVPRKFPPSLRFHRDVIVSAL